MADLLTQWKEQEADLKRRLDDTENLEYFAKDKVKLHSEMLKDQKRKMHQATKLRLKLKKELRLFWKRKKASMAYRRKWARDNPGQTCVLKAMI